MRLIYVSLILLICFSCGQSASTESDTTTEESEYPAAAEESQDKSPSTDEDEQQSGPVVYVTHDGDKYHTADCRYSKTAHPVKLSQAKADGKTACSICKPNSKTGEKQVRCSGTTAQGKRCQRLTSDKSGKCFQHRDG